ncbi:hypothetical protein M4D49_28960, partial [Cupriavidus pauculus]|uniref:hypothetical protein n=1 Tax=Cupriavidus pauculus TaxID=82633 RepID=UPI00203A92E0
KFYELHAVRPNAVTEQALARIGELYDIEREIRGQPPDLRQETLGGTTAAWPWRGAIAAGAPTDSSSGATTARRCA